MKTKNGIFRTAVFIWLIALPGICSATFIDTITGTWSVDKPTGFREESFRFSEDEETLTWTTLTRMKLQTVELRVQLIDESEIRATNAFYEKRENGCSYGGVYLTIEKIDEQTIELTYYRESIPQRAHLNKLISYTLNKRSDAALKVEAGETVRRQISAGSR